MTTMSEATERAHTIGKEVWQNMAQEMVARDGGLEDLQHMVLFHRGDQLLFSCTMTFADESEMKQSMVFIGMLLGSTPEATSTTMLLDTTVQANETMEHLIGENALVAATVEIDVLDQAVLFSRCGSLVHYIVEDAERLVIEEVVGAADDMSTFMCDAIEMAAGDVRTGTMEAVADEPLDDYALLMQAVDYIAREREWAFLPSSFFEGIILKRLLELYGPEQFADARREHLGLRLMTPRVAVIDNRETS